MKTFCFTVDDNIRFLKEIMESGCDSIFDHPYLAMYRRLHEQFGLKVQMNLFNRMDGFQLSQMSDAYRSEWLENADWLKLSFHSEYEKVRAYEFSGYDEVYHDCRNVHEQILRFASSVSLAKTTTIHYCLATQDGVRALADNQIEGLLGLFGSGISYSLDEVSAEKIRSGQIVKKDGISFAAIDVVLNCWSKEENLKQLERLVERDHINVMIHEQYFYPDYRAYQPDFEEKISAAFAFLQSNAYQSKFLEELL